MATLRTERGLDRLVNFSDATVAIAITLLILPLVDAATELRHATLGTVLHENLGLLISFGVSFVVIGRFWTVHHALFEHVRAYSPALVRMNFLWLAGIVFLPFAANVLSRSDGQPSISALYIGTMIVITGASGAMDWLLIHDEALRVPGDDGWLSMAPAIAFVVLLAVALIIAVLFPSINLYALLVLFFSGTLSKLIRRRETRPETRRATHPSE